ncbi:MAG: SDR family oxidoreductase [Opitutales bacterium]|nr:SDR family oxidoreductase [Opitutales bacterium]
MALAIDLRGRLALITGASGELGRVMARTLAQAGADIAVHYHGNEAKANALVDELKSLKVNAAAFQAEVGSLASVMAMRDAVFASLGEPGIVIANAVSQIWPWESVLNEAIGDYEDQFRSCVLHNVNLAKAFIPAMKVKQHGRYIGINTECTMQMLPTQSAYVSGKRGMDGVLRVLAQEVGPDQITVNQVAPGWTISERYRHEGTSGDEAYVAAVPMRRRGTDQEVANAVAFLASDLASFITGTYLPVCGGNVMPRV